MRTKKTLALMPLLSVALGALPATVTAEDAPAEERVTYEEHVRPIFRQHCFTCHNQNEKKGGLALDTYASVIEGGASGEIVYDGDGESSRLWQLMAHEDTPVMPPAQDKLADTLVGTVKTWIDNGLLENAGSKAKKKKANQLSFSMSADGKPEGPAAMPESVWKQPTIVTSRPGAVTALASSPWAPLVAVGGQEQVILYNTDTGELAGILPFPEGEPQSITFSRDGSYVLVGGGHHGNTGLAILYDVRTGDRLARAGDELDIAMGSDANAALTQVALGGPKRMVRIHDLQTGELLFDLKKHTDWVYDVRYSPDGILIASGDRAGGLVLWEADTGRLYLDLVGHKDAVRAVAWRADSNLVASASLDGTVKLWEVFNGNLIKSINAHGGGATAIDMARDGRFVTGGKDRVVKLWDANGNEVRAFPAMPEAVLEVAFSHDGKRVIAGDWSGQLRMWDAEDPNQVIELTPNPPTIETRLASAQQSAGEATRVFDEQTAAMNQLVQQLTAATTQLDTYNKQLAEAKPQAEQAEAARVAAQQAADQAAAALKAATDAVGPAQTQVQQAQGSVDQLIGQRNAAATALAQQEAAGKQAAAARDQAAATLATLDKQIADLENAGNAPADQLKALRDQRAAALAEHEKQTAAIAAAEQARLSAAEKHRQSVDAVNGQQPGLAAAQAALGAAQKALAVARDNHTATTTALKAAVATAEATKATVTQLEANIATAQKAVEDLTPQVEAAKAKVAEATAGRDAAVAKVQSLEADLAAFKAAHQQLTSAEAEANQQLATLTQSMQSAEQTATTVNEQLTGESTKLDELKKQMDALQAEVNRLREERRKAEEAQAAAVAAVEKVEAQRQKVADRRALYEAAYVSQ